MDPYIIIGFGAKDEANNIPKYLEQLDNIDYPEDRITYVAVTSPSKDNTVELVVDWLKTKKSSCWFNFDATSIEPLRKRMFTCTNYIRHLVTINRPPLPRYDYLFQCDADVIGIPPETLKELIKLDVDIVAPYIYNSQEDAPSNKFKYKKTFRDIWGFRFKYGPHRGLQFNSSVADYYKRNMYRDDTIKADKEKGIIPMISVGANPILIKREVLENVHYNGLHATPGFCMMADEMGYNVWSYPALECIHDWRKQLS